MYITNYQISIPFPAKQQVVEYTEKSQDKHECRNVQLVREYGFHPRSKVQVQDGDMLPRKFEPFPQTMYGRPLEEIDNFIYEDVSITFFSFNIVLLGNLQKKLLTNFAHQMGKFSLRILNW